VRRRESAIVVTSLDDSAAKQNSEAIPTGIVRPGLIPGPLSRRLEDTMMRTSGYILSLLMLCGVASENVALAGSSTLATGIRPSASITKVAHRNKVAKRRKPSRPKHRKSNHPTASKHRQ